MFRYYKSHFKCGNTCFLLLLWLFAVLFNNATKKKVTDNRKIRLLVIPRKAITAKTQ